MTQINLNSQFLFHSIATVFVNFNFLCEIFVDFRGGRRKKTPQNSKNYPPTAWYRYVDSHKPCKYKCQGVEYIWWGYCSFSGLCAGRSGSKEYQNQFNFLKKSQLVKGDKPLTKLFTDSANSDSDYKLPTHYVDGKYTGCKTCSTGGKNHGGS